MSELSNLHGGGCGCLTCVPTPGDLYEPADNEDAYPTTPYQEDDTPPAPLTPTVDLLDLINDTVTRLDTLLSECRAVLDRSKPK